MDGGGGPDIGGWAHALCHAPTAVPADVAVALGLDLGQARAIGVQLVCPPLAGTGRVELVLDPGGRDVSFVEVSLAAEVPLAQFTAVFGAGRLAPRGPHESATVIFDRLCPTGAVRSCGVLARLASDYPTGGPVTSVTMYLHPVLRA